VKPRPFLQGAGLATLYVAPFAADFLTPTLGDAYRRLHPLTTIYRAIFLLAIALWIGSGIVFWFLERLPERWKRIFWLLPSVILPWLFLRSMASAFADWPRIAILVMHIEHALVPAIGILGLGLLLLIPTIGAAAFDKCVTGIRVSYMICGFGLLVIVPQIGNYALRSEPREQSAFVQANLPAVPASSPRIVWILMDELSYDQVFDHRQPDVVLPNFEDLARSSVSFSAIQPAGKWTEEVLPALLLGKPVVDLRKPYAGPPSYRSTPKGAWQRFNQYDTIFAEAQSLGWTSGIAGWYNPYCRLLPDVVNRCFWQYSEPGSFDLASSLKSTNSVTENIAAMAPFRGKIQALRHRPVLAANQLHRDDYISLMAHANELLNDSRIRFAFVHLPVPHPPGIYDRHSHIFSNQGTYLDNLVLADQALGALRDVIQSTPAAANTTLIVSSDHSWRTFWWRGSGAWSAEAERITQGGKFDSRPVLMVHLPGSDSGQVIAKPVNVLVVHPILDGLLRGQIHTPSDLNNIVNRQPQGTESAQSGN
jgi:Sulfatase